MRSAIVVTALLCLSTPVLAAQDVEISLNATTPKGRQPGIILKANRAVLDMEVQLDRSDKQHITLHSGRMKKGATKELPLGQPDGVFTYDGTLSVHFPDVEEPASMPLHFEAAVLPPPQLLLNPEDVKLEENRVEVTMDRPCRRLTFKVVGDDGVVMDSGNVDFRDLPAGQKLPVVWTPNGRPVMRIDVVGHDVHGYFSPTLQLSPWSLEIPHQDVNFASGQSTIPAAEQPKLKAAVQDIHGAIKRYGKVVRISLFIAGHTDTVGSADVNRALSLARAQAIGQAFRSAGIQVPIHTQGFGEDAPKLKTPDETPEEQNRRAAYILSVEEPFAAGGWSALP